MGHRRFTMQQVEMIRTAVDSGALTQKQLAEMYGCTQSTISNVVNHVTYPEPVVPLFKRGTTTGRFFVDSRGRITLEFEKEDS